MTIMYATRSCRLGELAVAYSTQGLCGLLLADDKTALKRELEHHFPHATPSTHLDVCAQQAAAFSEGQRDWKPVLDIQGTLFQQAVWHALQTIPNGTTITYQQLAQRMGKSNAVRAVASACAANKIAILIPCHRVIRSDGTIGGYRWGIERKKTLLQQEQVPNLKP